MTHSSLPTLARALVAASALVLIAPSAMAQSYYDSEESVTVQAPPYPQRDRTTGAPIRNVALQREVRMDDLDLRTERGAQRLYERINYTAHALCRRLDNLYPISADDNAPCYQTAMADAMEQAEDAVARARGW